MARLVKNDWQSMKQTDLNDPVCLVVDMVNGFADAGALADKEIAALSKPIETLVQNMPSAFICDAHMPGAKEFEAYPVHCLKGDKESEVIDELLPYASERMEKNSTNAFFSPAFQAWFEQNQNAYTDWIVTGCCTDLCVLQLALSLRTWANQFDKDIRIIVPANCVDTFDSPAHSAPFWNEAALNNLSTNGVLVIGDIE